MKGKTLARSILILIILTFVGVPAHSNTIEGLIKYVSKMPRGTLDIPAYWFEMESLAGWEHMILVIGYADNGTVCQHLLETSKRESPQRNFRCSAAN